MTGRSLLARILGVLRRNRTDQFEEEMTHHSELLAAEYVARGMTETEARYAARRELGNVLALREQYREQNGLPLLENFLRDFRFAVRSLRRNLAFTSSCTATLAVGLGSMTTVLCAVSAFVWTPLPYPHPDRLVAIEETDPRNGAWPFSEPAWLDLQARSRSVAEVAAYRRSQLALTGTGNTETVQATAVTPSFFRLFGIRLLNGRAFDDGQKAVVISRALWKRQWQMAEGVLGKAIVLDGETYTIAGIGDLPADLIPGTDLLFPLAPRATESRTAHDLEAVGSLAPGVDRLQAQAELSGIAASIARDNPGSNAGWSMRLIPLAEYVIGPRTSGMVWMIFAAVALLWLLACANVAGLQMARSLARRHEMNTRLALGASRGRLFAQNLTEGLVLAATGAGFGFGAAQPAIEAIRRFAAASFPRLAHVRMTGWTVGMAAGFMLASTLLFTIFTGRTAGLRGCRGISRRDRGRDALIVAQVALASALLLGASLLFHSFLRLKAVDPGFDPERILTVHVTLPGRTYDTPRRVGFFREATLRVERLPEVESAGATNVAPFSGESTANRFGREEEVRAGEFRVAAWRAVSADFFATLGIPLKRGRLFTNADVDGSGQVVILSESMARKFWPDQDPIGRKLLWGRSGSPKTIVGIVGDLRDLAVDSPPVPTMFRPFAQLADAPMTLVVRTKGDPAAAIADVRRELWAIDRDAALDFQPLRSAMSRSILLPRASLLSVAAFAAVATITAAFGLYGLIGYRVNQRQQEIGMRLALGAPEGSVRWSVQRRCLGLVAAGLAIGLPVAYGLSTLMRSLLYETQPADWSAYAGVLLVFVTVASMASYGPARRASRMDPAVAIRHE